MRKPTDNVVALRPQAPQDTTDAAVLARIRQPVETYFACCYVDPEGFIHPNPETVHHTTKGCADRARYVLGLTRYRRKAEGWRILQFQVVLRPRWTEEV